ncbi:hypothetical protein [Asticcacaulis endophyticus]|nr:hypothetical protein [Asticcacaulis endophyticus]
MKPIDPIEFYAILRAYFIDLSEDKGVVIAPLFGQKRNIKLSNTLYFEYMDNRIIDIKFIEEGEIDDRFCISNFNMYGRDCRMLTVQTKCLLDDLPVLWEVRNHWISLGLEPEL